MPPSLVRPERSRDSAALGDCSRRLVSALAAPSTYPGRPRVAVHETHGSWVFVAGERAYKVKKPVDLGFLDYSTLPRRHEACREELRVNRELAGDLYLAVRAIVPDRHGGYRLAPEHAPGAIEYAVEMRRFDEAATLAGLISAGALGREHLEATARRLAEFHRAAARVGGGTAGDVLAMWRQNVAQTGRAGRRDTRRRIDTLVDFGEAFVTRNADEIDRRARAGLVRDGHGDLRCDHVLVVPTVRVVDRIEFDSGLRHTDVACDLAFLAMDLEVRGERWAARALVDAYARAGGDPASASLHAFYAAYRALVRAKVARVAAAQRPSAARAGDAEALLELAERLSWRARRPLALVVCGPAASGKSTLAAALSSAIELEVLASDHVRKQLAGLAPTEHAAADHYSAAFTRRTYDELGRRAAERLRNDGGVIVDATCRAREQRTRLLTALAREGITPLFVRCELSLELALERAAKRLHEPGSASDATPQIVAEQFGSFEPLDELPARTVLAVDTRARADETVPEIGRALDALAAGDGG